MQDLYQKKTPKPKTIFSSLEATVSTQWEREIKHKI